MKKARWFTNLSTGFNQSKCLEQIVLQLAWYAKETKQAFEVLILPSQTKSKRGKIIARHGDEIVFVFREGGSIETDDEGVISLFWSIDESVNQEKLPANPPSISLRIDTSFVFHEFFINKDGVIKTWEKGKVIEKTPKNKRVFYVDEDWNPNGPPLPRNLVSSILKT